MKRILTLVLAVFMLSSLYASAQVEWGVTAGLNFNTSKFSEIKVKARTGWSAGGTCLVDLPLGFSFQPSLLYHQKGVNISDRMSQNMGYLELPVSLQWGPDLLIFRPFVDVTPYIGYALSNKFVSPETDISLTENGWKGKERFEYGLGIGGGVNVWKLQVIARYNWNFGSLYNVYGWDDIKPNLKDLNPRNENFGGMTISLAYLF